MPVSQTSPAINASPQSPGAGNLDSVQQLQKWAQHVDVTLQELNVTLNKVNQAITLVLKSLSTGSVKISTPVTPNTVSGQLGMGSLSGFGNGAAGTAVTTTLQGSGTGPATPQTVVKYLQISLNGLIFYIPLMQ